MSVAKYKYLLIISLLFNSLNLSLHAASPARVVKVMGDWAYPPFEFINDAGEPDGFNIDLMRAIFKELNWNYELELTHWVRATKCLEEGTIQLMTGMVESPVRSQYFQFSIPHNYIYQCVITRKKDFYNTLESLKGKSIVIQDWEITEDILKQHHITDQLTIVDNMSDGLRLIAEGNQDAAICGERLAQYIINKDNLDNLCIHPLLNLEPYKFSMAFNLSDSSLVAACNKGFEIVKSKGIYNQIYDKWFGIHDYNKKMSTAIYFILALVVTLLMITVFFAYLLRGRVKRATYKLNDLNNELELALKAGKLSAWIYSPTHDRIQCLYGKRSLMNGLSLENTLNLIHPEDRSVLKQLILDILQEKKEAVNCIVRFKDNQVEGGYIYIESEMIGMRNQKNQLEVIGTQKDVTEKRLRQLQLERSEMNLRLVLNNTQAGLIYFSNDFSVQWENVSLVFPNHPYANRFIDGKSCYLSFNGMQGPCPHCIVERSLKSGHIEREENEVAGSTLELTATPVWDKNHLRIGTVLKVVDISDKRHVISELQKAKEKAEESDKLKSAFVVNMSHEIRTPLNAIVGFSELIVNSKNDEEKKQYSDFIHLNSELLLKLITDILDLSKIEAGFIELTPITFDLVSFFEGYYATLKQRLTNPHVSLICESAYKECVVVLDNTRLSQLVLNFVTNAIKFTQEGEIRIEYTYENDGLLIKVSDTGIGIPASQKELVFERFHKQDDFEQGTGLGLAICKAIVEAHHGKIGVDSEINKGSTFWAWLPCKMVRETLKNETTAPIPEEIEDPVEADAAILSRKSILIAEDNDSNFLLLNTILQKRFNTKRALNGVDAVDLARSQDFDVILMDMKMPKMDGLEATRQIRQFKSKVPIIALTANAYESDKQMAMDAGCNDYLTKPINWALLFQTLDKWAPSLQDNLIFQNTRIDQLL